MLTARQRRLASCCVRLVADRLRRTRGAAFIRRQLDGDVTVDELEALAAQVLSLGDLLDLREDSIRPSLEGPARG